MPRGTPTGHSGAGAILCSKSSEWGLSSRWGPSEHAAAPPFSRLLTAGGGPRRWLRPREVLLAPGGRTSSGYRGCEFTGPLGGWASWDAGCLCHMPHPTKVRPPREPTVGGTPSPAVPSQDLAHRAPSSVAETPAHLLPSHAGDLCV